MKHKYTHLLFDLDNTLWDFNSNAQTTLLELYSTYAIKQYVNGFDVFMDAFSPVNKELWRMYLKGKLQKTELNLERFKRPLNAIGCFDELVIRNMAQTYLEILPTQTGLMPGALEVIQNLHSTYQLHIVSNGMKVEQYKKMTNSGLLPYFTKVFVSDQLGVAKPHVYFFDYVVKSLHATKNQCCVIGDSLEADIKGAQKAGIDAVYYNPMRKEHAEVVEEREVAELSELMEFFR